MGPSFQKTHTSSIISLVHTFFMNLDAISSCQGIAQAGSFLLTGKALIW
ncbi:MAG: hypothetical protein JEZ02_05140 [Desulfatibacillum sp.]|nr:hypothetical protein [Desulfatibacillum sp.]